MVTDNRKIQIEVTADSSAVRPGLNQGKEAVNDFAEESKRKINETGVALKNLASTGEDSARQIAASTRNLESSIKRATTSAITQLGELAGARKGTSESFAIRAESLGIDQAELSKSINSLRKVEEAIGAVSEKNRQAAESERLLAAERRARETAAIQLAESTRRAEAASAAAASKRLQETQRAQDQFIKGLEREVMMLNMTTAEWKAYQAAQLGVSSRAAPLIAQLNNTSKGINSLGLNAKETTWALRQLPAQFTDIFVSLQGGQNPLTVLIQQGGQIKDMFGGVGPALRGVGSAIAAMINPVTVTAAAIAALGAGFVIASNEAEKLTNTLITSGRDIGGTMDKIINLSSKIAESSDVTRGAVQETMLEIVNTSGIAEANYEKVARAATEWERVTGKAASDTVKEFAALGEKPVEAVLKLNKQYNFLTADVFKQIQALETSGKVAEAAALAQDAYYQALQEKQAKIIDQSGTLTGALLAVKDAAKGAYDNFLNLFRGDSWLSKGTLEQELKKLQDQLSKFGFDDKETQRMIELTEEAIDAQNRLAESEKRVFEQEAARIELLRASNPTDAKIIEQRKEMVRLANVYEKAIVGATEAERQMYEQQYLNAVSKALTGNIGEVSKSLDELKEKFKDTPSKLLVGVESLSEGQAKLFDEMLEADEKSILSTADYAILQAKRAAEEKLKVAGDNRELVKAIETELSIQIEAIKKAEFENRTNLEQSYTTTVQTEAGKRATAEIEAAAQVSAAWANARSVASSVSTPTGISLPAVLQSDSTEVPQYADGGYHSGGWRIVGERGPELEYTGPSQIINSKDTMNMLGGSITIQNLNLPGISNAKQFIDEIQKMLRTNPNLLTPSLARAG